MKRKNLILLSSLIFLFCFVALPGQINSQTLRLLSNPPAENIVAYYDRYDTGGNTSLAHDLENSFKWSGNSPYKSGGWGYFTPDGTEVPYIKRDRDLGQTFRVDKGKKLRLQSITLKLGYGDNVVRTGMYGKKLSLQFFEVKGTPVLNDNGTVSGMKALHGFPHDRAGQEIDHRRDDYIDGEKYISLLVINGFRFPWKKEFGIVNDSITVSPDDARLKGMYLKFSLPGNQSITLEPGKTYAFLVMIDKPGEDYGFTLANNYTGSYEHGHAIRRDGNGVFPPVPANPLKDFTHPENRKAMESAHFPADFSKRILIPPGTNGYPDVDTWRDLVFYIEASPVENRSGKQ